MAENCVKGFVLLLASSLLAYSQASNTVDKIDPHGYVTYCPCMGRFGNQADHFLGALSFAHGLDRTLILPPWVEYPGHIRGSVQIPFDDYFKVEPLREYHRVITMETFMKELAPTLWPKGKRTGFCYRYRDGKDCKMKEGNPFGPFWDNINVDFDNYEEFGPLSYNTHLPAVRAAWEKRFPVSEYPVLAMSGAPASFPVTEANRPLHRFLHWSDQVEEKVDAFIREHLSSGPFVGIHMRIGSDWVNACKHASSSRQMFASPQCLGPNNEFGEVTDDLCMPPRKVVIKQIKDAVKKVKATAVFVASDVDPNIKELQAALPKKVKVIQNKPANPHMDLAILAKSDHYICNCISTFSAFAKRERDAAGKPSSFWVFSKTSKKSKSQDEL
ncbi:GDP-fucose protein O-fucosyltransferase 1-like [Diadema antillarum]|uniref:GDP-fucose protein O-fucosyltransferase 1-like n=1 Tax=Diadema antillarum TaxID=105358 RepID=UPI003A86CDF5